MIKKAGIQINTFNQLLIYLNTIHTFLPQLCTLYHIPIYFKRYTHDTH